MQIGHAGETVGASYKLEYGEDRIEMHTGAIQKGQRVLLVDDLIATGGTLAAGVKLVEQVSHLLSAISQLAYHSRPVLGGSAGLHLIPVVYQCITSAGLQNVQELRPDSLATACSLAILSYRKKAP